MKKYLPILIAVIGIAALIMSSATTAQVPRTARPSPWSEMRLRPGQQIILNASNNSIVEVTTDLTLAASEHLNYVDPQTGNLFSLPNGDNIVRLQGNVVISRDKEATSRNSPNVRWRNVETIWPAYRSDGGPAR